MTDSQIDLLTGDGWRDSELFTDKEKAAIWWADEVTNLRAKQNKAAANCRTDLYLRYVEFVGPRGGSVAFGR